ncbi:c-type cytochrome [Pseudomonas sp. P7]|uniref:c-type cytochrome n=1 Tax=Pseudomonas TaxID=286 RepID=UPI0015EC10F3|nr:MULTISPECIES: c-type cytochrome [Pseudomonas]MBA2922872.1 c-type cytochrome [Pseudomonas sivasensis]MBP5950084.1 c-type cytochrome [Pseudomonas sp. P42]
MLTSLRLPLFCALLSCLTQAALAEECSSDRSRGAQLFANECSACHSVTKGVTGMMGPSLAGVIGRKSGALAGFNYSQAMRGKDFNWQVENIAQLIEQPQAFMPGTYMPYAGMASAQDRQAVACFVKEQQ